MEFGARRAHNFDAAILGARAAYIAGCAGSATTYSGKEFGVCTWYNGSLIYSKL